MGFAEAVRACLRNYVTFSGRAGRPEYWWFLLFVVLAGLAASALDALLFGAAVETGGGTAVEEGEGAVGLATGAGVSAGPLNALVSLATVLPLLAAGWRRMHDVGRTGWWLFLGPAAAILTAPLVLVFGESAAFLPGLAALAGALAVLWLLARPGDPGPNRFGPPSVSGPSAPA